MERMEVLLNQYVKSWRDWVSEDNSEIADRKYDNYWGIRESLKETYNVNYEDRDLLVNLLRYSRNTKKPIYWVIESWYKLTNRKMKSIRQNWLKAKSKVEADGLVFDDYYEESDNEVHRAKLDQDGYDVTEEYASDSV